MAGRPTHDAVRHHYDSLAPAYNRKAYQACERAYRKLVGRCLSVARNVLEIGAGSSGQLSALDAERKAACDLSLTMLRARSEPQTVAAIAADAHRFPFRDGSFDAVYSINVIEHVEDPRRVFQEVARILTPGGLCLAITPNGGLEIILNLLERLRLKLPEGPHRFLTFDGLEDIAGDGFDVLEHQCFLAFPAGPGRLVDAIDRLARGRGLFQYVLLRKRG